MRNDELKIYDIDAAELAKLKFAVIHTEKGDMKLELYGHRRAGLAHQMRVRRPKTQAQTRSAIYGARRTRYGRQSVFRLSQRAAAPRRRTYGVWTDRGRA